MILSDFTDLPGEPYDFTIIGSGFAGLYLAEAFERAGLRTLVVEQGPLDDPQAEGAGYYEIDATGLDYPALGERIAAFGGSSGHWGGMSRPLSSTVFAERPHLDCRGWPISHDAFMAHIDAAKRWLRHPHGPDDPSYRDPASGFLPGPTEGLAAHDFVTANSVRRLGVERRDWISASPTVDLLILHRATELYLDESGIRTAGLQVVDTRSGITGRLGTAQVVLATGGIENARLLLSSGRTLPPGNPFTGKHARTGATLMEHPKFVGLELLIDETFPLSDTNWHSLGGVARTLRVYSLEERLFEEFALPRFAVILWGGSDRQAQLPNPLRRLDRVMHGREKHYRRSVPEFEFEQLPRDASFIALSDRTDRFGYPLARMHWTISDEEMASYWKAFNIFASLISQCGAVRARLRFATLEDFVDRAQVRIQHHHMGSTAMSHDDRTGVVDPNCRVHGVENLHVAGSSVFPTGDYVNPTLNLVALADRLSHHLIGSAR